MIRLRGNARSINWREIITGSMITSIALSIFTLPAFAMENLTHKQSEEDRSRLEVFLRDARSNDNPVLSTCKNIDEISARIKLALMSNNTVYRGHGCQLLLSLISHSVEDYETFSCALKSPYRGVRINAAALLIHYNGPGLSKLLEIAAADEDAEIVSYAEKVMNQALEFERQYRVHNVVYTKGFSQKDNSKNKERSF